MSKCVAIFHKSKYEANSASTFGLMVSFLMLLLGTKVSLAPPTMPPDSVVSRESSRLSKSLLLSRWRAGDRRDIGLNLAEGRMFSL